MTMVVSDDYRQAAAALGRLLGDHSAPPATQRMLDEDHVNLWKQLRSDGWTEVGGSSGAGKGPPLSELAPIAEAWGRHLVPLPFIESILHNRWAQFSESNWSIVAFPRSQEQILVPFGLESDSGLSESDVVGEDRFSPSLPLTIASISSSVNMTQAREALALYVAASVGAADFSLHFAMEHALERQAFGQVIGQFQALKHRFANMLRDLELARTAALWAAQASVRDAVPALLASTLARQVIEGAGQIFGGMSFTWELGLHFYLRYVIVVEKLAQLCVSPK